MDTGATPDRQPEPARWLAIGERIAEIEQAAIRLGTISVHRFRKRHPWVYGLIAFMVGSGLLGIFTMSTYTNWSFEGIDLKLAMYQVIFGMLGGGIAMIVLAFAYARTIQPIVVD